MANLEQPKEKGPASMALESLPTGKNYRTRQWANRGMGPDDYRDETKSTIKGYVKESPTHILIEVAEYFRFEHDLNEDGTTHYYSMDIDYMTRLANSKECNPEGKIVCFRYYNENIPEGNIIQARTDHEINNNKKRPSPFNGIVFEVTPRKEPYGEEEIKNAIEQYLNSEENNKHIVID